MSLDCAAVVTHYKANFRERARLELDSFRAARTLDEAIARAALSETPAGKRYPHQRRLKRTLLDAVRIRLLDRASLLIEAGSFSALYDAVSAAVRQLSGAGELYLYDVALRIGAMRGLMPEMIYLHAGTRKGAAALGLETSGRFLFKNQFDDALRELEPYEIEDVLCIYKGYLSGSCAIDEVPGCRHEGEDAEKR